MKAALFKGKDHPLTIEEVKKPKPIKDQVLIKMKYAALNHRDLWVMQEQAQHLPNGIILGSDGSGVVDDVGEDADPLLVGAEVVINPSLDWGNNPIVQGDAFRILGFPDNGTFAEYMVISKKYIFEKPEHLSFEESAAVPLSALTAYRALFSKARLRAKEKVLITGIGGGAALWVLQFAVAYQARVFVTSGSDEKLKKAKELGAIGGFNYKDPEWAAKAQKETGGFDIIIDSAGGDQFSKLIELALPGGRIVNFGRTAGNITDISTRLLYWKQLSIHGSTMGTRDEFLSMIDFLESRKLKPVMDKTYALKDITQAFQRMEQGEHFGKIVLDIGK
ncbi:zinc-binding dehydrogenase [Fulvivirgaceae bacterium PWU4]|uniref:Zinc-binding dehydrogenase n=1 Tax=Chryseosolibacter histidini TaxID=2782349 RepID=A0AAP2DNA9_9BACT|nr:zinc-binding dehydrogenase [Chryseosolibacter histidini]MBT1699446.1 zinc-binding dehydrogenase [Chryseosolibacter histidini]